MRARIVSAIVMFLSLASCGGGSASDPGGGGGTGGRGGGSIRGGFRLTGSVSRTAAVRVAALNSADNVPSAGGLLAAPAEKTVTHVMAVNPSSQNPRRAVAPLGADGSFSLDLEPGRPWVLVFIDSSRVGADMIAGVFRASELDTIAPMMEGSADLGMVQVMEEEQMASAGIAYDDLLAAMNLSDEGADFLGRMDDVCLRYVNPDIDGDGTIDVLQTQREFQLDFHVQYRAQAAGGSSATVADLIGRFLSDSTTTRYAGVGVYASYATSFASPAASEMWASFDEPMVYFPAASTTGPASSRTVGPGERVPGADLSTLRFGDAMSQGVSAAVGHDLPQGRYQFGMGSRVLTFTNVRTHTDAELAAAEDLILPFVSFVPTDGCSSDCTIANIEYRWMRRTAAGWVPATAEEIALVVGEQGGFISISKGSPNAPARLMWTIPTSPATGAVMWSAAMLEGLQAAEAASTKTSEICHLGISYDDKLGMRIFSGIENAPGTCPM